MSGAKRSSRRPSHPKPQEPSTSKSEPTWPTISFLFTVNSLPVNEEPSLGGVAPRTDEQGRWLPPVYRAGFGAQRLGTLYRWENGVISPATGFQWYHGAWWRQNAVATTYRANTMFYCNPFEQFLATGGDASGRDMATAPVPDDRWYTLNFHHRYDLSRLDIGGSEQYLAGNGARFIEQLGISSWSNPDPNAPASSGIAGNLALLIALVAFSCRSDRMDSVLRNTWTNYQWRGHSHHHGRHEGRGVVVTIYYDPQNPQSTQQSLSELEFSGGQLLL